MQFALTVILALATWTPAVAAGNGAEAPSPWQDWQATRGLDSPLLGQIWSAHDMKLVKPDVIVRKAAIADFVLIGETHDNADHHRLQAWLIGKIADKRRPAVVMEMITADQAPKLRTYLAKPDADAAGLGAAIEWEASGWPDWSQYQPIGEAAFEDGLAIVAGSPSRARSREISRDGLDTIETDERRRLALDLDLPLALDEALLEDIRQSHCGLLPEEALPAMTEVQRYRDAVLANSLVSAGANSNGVVLITGNGHARTDRGVPWYLTRLAAGASVTVVMLIEVDDEASLPAELLIEAPDGTPAADFFWFTSQAARQDPCELMRRQFGKQPTPQDDTAGQ